MARYANMDNKWYHPITKLCRCLFCCQGCRRNTSPANTGQGQSNNAFTSDASSTGRHSSAIPRFSGHPSQSSEYIDEDGDYIDMIIRPDKSYPVLDISKQEAEQLVVEPPYKQGRFLIRKSATEPGSFVLCVCSAEGRCKPYKMRTHLQKYYVAVEPNYMFSNLHDLIKHFTDNRSGSVERLSVPVVRKRNMVTIPQRMDNFTLKTTDILQKELIAEGQLWRLYKGKLSGNMEIAIKKPKTRDLTTSKMSMIEAEKLKILKHNHILQFYGLFKDEQTISMVVEFAPLGCLHDYWKTIQDFQIDDQIVVAQQVLNAMVFLEENNYVHRNLRASKVLVIKKGIYKIGDLASSRKLEDGEYDATGDFKFPTRWTAPESLQFNKFTIRSDVFSFGPFMYEVTTKGRLPFEEIPEKDVRGHIINGGVPLKPNECEDVIYTVIRNCCVLEAIERPTFKSLYQFFSDFDAGYVELDQS